jgi:hypothetical protein
MESMWTSTFSVVIASRPMMIRPWKIGPATSSGRHSPQERMRYLDQEGKIVYASKACPGPRSEDGNSAKIFDALEWLAVMCSLIPDRGADALAIKIL